MSTPSETLQRALSSFAPLTARGVEPQKSRWQTQMEKLCAWIPTSINWEAIAAIATFLAVIVALLPILKEGRRATALARNLRIRIGSKLILLRPTLISLSLRKGETEIVQPGVLSPTDFLIDVHELDAILGESAVLTPGEQDQLGVTMLNLNLLARLYYQGAITSETAQNVLELIDQTTKCVEKHGLLTTEISTPWQD